MQTSDAFLMSVMNDWRNTGAMHTAEHTPSAPEMTAAVINGAVDRAEDQGSVSARELGRTIEDAAEGLELNDQEVQQYVTAIQRMSHDAAIGPLPDGVGGQFNGSITVATDTLKVPAAEAGRYGVAQTIARMEETFEHELYHAMHHHTDPMMTYDGSSTVVIAGEGFETTEIIEGLTVDQTGAEFVSPEYRQYREDLFRAIAAADIDLNDLKAAVNEQHDFTLIDDRRPKPLAA